MQADPKLRIWLKDRRVEAGLTQAQLADQAGLSRKTINTVENGVFIPSTLVALRIAAALGLNVEAIFELDDGDAAAPRPPRAISPDDT